MIAVKDIAWAAGFLEGEGSFGKSVRSIQMHAPQKNIEPLLKLKSLFGGRLRTYTHPTWKNPMSDWGLSGQNAAQVMMTIYTLMSKKRQERIREAMLYWKTTKLPESQRTHCPNGHPYNNINTYRFPRSNYRYCRVCRREAIRERVRRKRNAC